ncbi:MAG TPA: hypothetical protein VGE37_00175, partial [Archangium sp.]
MRLSSWWLAAFALCLSACRCTTPIDITQMDGSFLEPVACADSSECALGQDCVEGRCQAAVIEQDAGIECTLDTDCGPQRRCVPSTGRCIDVFDFDAGTDDGGSLVSVCNQGDQQTCGSSKLGECRLGTRTCVV